MCEARSRTPACPRRKRSVGNELCRSVGSKLPKQPPPELAAIPNTDALRAANEAITRTHREEPICLSRQGFLACAWRVPRVPKLLPEDVGCVFHQGSPAWLIKHARNSFGGGLLCRAQRYCPDRRRCRFSDWRPAPTRPSFIAYAMIARARTSRSISTAMPGKAMLPLEAQQFGIVDALSPMVASHGSR